MLEASRLANREGENIVRKQLPVLFTRLALFSIILALATPLHAQTTDELPGYTVTITNLTKAQRMSAPLIWSHNTQSTFFELGMPASQALATGAESGSTADLSAIFLRSADVANVVKSGQGTLFPGGSVSLTVRAGGDFNRLSYISMLNPTNDAFAGLQGFKVPNNNKLKVVDVPAYDAGSETNDELCKSIPGTTCRGEGVSTNDRGEGFVYLHTGIHGPGDLKPEDRDWRNPVVRLTIQRVCGGIQGLSCAEGHICDLPSAQCQSADLQGVCVERPDACIQVFDPVCGCDGKTYSNDCERLMNGIPKDHDGAC